MKDGDLQMYDEIESQMLNMAVIKGKAFDDSEIIEDELEILEDLSERGINNPEANFGRQSEDSEALHSVRSSVDYWQEKLDQRQQRVRTLRAANNKNEEE